MGKDAHNRAERQVSDSGKVNDAGKVTENAGKTDPRPVNSRRNAEKGLRYHPVPRPNTPAEIVETLDIWAHYLHAWGKRVRDAIEAAPTGQHSHQDSSGATHLDPPPPPYS